MVDTSQAETLLGIIGNKDLNSKQEMHFEIAITHLKEYVSYEKY